MTSSLAPNIGPAARDGGLTAPRHVQNRLTVVTVTYNSAGHLPDFLAMVHQAMVGIPHWELVVADNASSDGSAQLVAQLAPAAKVVAMSRNRGYAAGINAAVAASEASDAVLVLNPDVMLRSASAQLLRNALTEPDTGIAVPRLLDRDGRLLWSLRRDPSLLRAIGEGMLGRRAGRLPAFGEVILDPRRYECGSAVDWASGAAMMISRKCLDVVGPWDESFFLYSEETEFALRARDKGFLTRYVPGATATHLNRESAPSSRLWTILIMNRVRLYRRRHGIVSSVAFWGAVTFGEVLRAVVGRPRSRAAVAALLTSGWTPIAMSE